MGDLEGTTQSENDDISLEAKIFLTLVGGTFGMLRFDEKTFFKTSLGFTPYWDCTPTNASHVETPLETLVKKMFF